MAQLKTECIHAYGGVLIILVGDLAQLAPVPDFQATGDLEGPKWKAAARTSFGRSMMHDEGIPCLCACILLVYLWLKLPPLQWQNLNLHHIGNMLARPLQGNANHTATQEAA